ncbi:hypothetical protein FF098_008840 [Parvularcula flava]|uniref:Transmembrane protein n=1 Tax=Aquisalinus luteolus TaxID=1566827 RepID=A0A8J3EQY1_9PROT|nr:hypothetical protein [Aquisalinus luteolus]NHK28008.1 hypothetical protein [Aquisalinus luteolus]GGH97188.1 hypothetical protein GCM10011355_17800 [Aquisalinus luteolus]
MSDQPVSPPFHMTFTVWYRRVFQWGISLLFLPASVQAYLTLAEGVAGPMDIPRLLLLATVLAVVWAIAAVFFTLVLLGLEQVLRPASARQAGFGERFTSRYQRVFIWGPCLLFFVLTAQAWLTGLTDGSVLQMVTPLLLLMVVLTILWAVLAVLVSLALVGVLRAIGRRA